MLFDQRIRRPFVERRLIEIKIECVDLGHVASHGSSLNTLTTLLVGC